MILFLCAGIASAHENGTIANGDLSIDDNMEKNNIKDLIDECKDENLNLDEKTYYLNPENETHIVLNKSITISGIDGKTIIDGNNTSLFLDVNETEDEIDNDTPILIWHDGYDFKYLGKNITFKNITFKDLKMTTWHEMTFLNCKFINTTFTSYEYSNTFNNCDFNKSKIEIVLFNGFYNSVYEDYSKILNCNLYESIITYKLVYGQGYIDIVGGDSFYITNSLDLMNTNLYNSNISLYRNNITINNSNFNNSNIKGSSNILNIENTDFDRPQIALGYSIISICNASIENPKFELHGGYFSIGCELSLENATINNCELKTSVNYGFRTGSLKIKNSQIQNSTFYLEDFDAMINNSQFNKSSFEFFFSDANILDSTFVNDGNVTDTLKTKEYNEIYKYDDSGNYTIENRRCQLKTNYTAVNSYLINGSGKFEIKNEDINKDTTDKITIINENNTFYFNDKLIIKVEDYLGNPISGLEIYIENQNNYVYPTPSVKTNSKGIAKYSLDYLGNVSLKIYYQIETIMYRLSINSKDVNLTIFPTVTGIEVSKLNFNKNTYSNIKGYLKIKTIANSSADLKGLIFKYKVYTNGKAKTYYTNTNSNGITTFKLPKTLTAGTHKIKITLVNTNVTKTVNVKVDKAKTTVKAPKVTNKLKKSKYFKLTVKNKATKKAVSNVKVKIKVYTAKKYKIYTVKTNKKGIGKINTKTLKAGIHKVVVSSGNSNYEISAKSLITIK